MATVLKIGNIITLAIALQINDAAAKPAEFKFKLTAKRMSAQEWDEHFAPNQNNPKTVREFLLERITGWEGQTLVIDDQTNQPAPFTPENFDLMLGVLGVQDVVFQTYLLEVRKAAAPEAKAKN